MLRFSPLGCVSLPLSSTPLPWLISDSPVFFFFSDWLPALSGFFLVLDVSQVLLHHLWPTFLVHSTQPGHPAVRPYLSRMHWRMCNLFARQPRANLSFGWIVGPCGVLLAVTFHRPPTHRFKNCKSQGRLYCSCWRQQEKFIGQQRLLAYSTCSTR